MGGDGGDYSGSDLGDSEDRGGEPDAGAWREALAEELVARDGRRRDESHRNENGSWLDAPWSTLPMWQKLLRPGLQLAALLLVAGILLTAVGVDLAGLWETLRKLW